MQVPVLHINFFTSTAQPAVKSPEFQVTGTAFALTSCCTCDPHASVEGCTSVVAPQVGRADSKAMTEGRATLARLSEWMLTHQGSMWPRSAASAAKAYANGKLRLTWLDAGMKLHAQI